MWTVCLHSSLLSKGFIFVTNYCMNLGSGNAFHFFVFIFVLFLTLEILCCSFWFIFCSMLIHTVGFYDLTVVVMKSFIFWDMMPCTPLKVNWRSGGTCCLHLQGQRISQAWNKCEVGGKQSSVCRLLSRWYLGRLILRPWRWRR
jgi:hypothetical protein